MNILVIGGAGYIGSHVTHELCDQGYKVAVLDDLSSGFIGNVDKRSDFIEKSFMDIVNSRNPGEKEFHQAVHEVV